MSYFFSIYSEPELSLHGHEFIKKILITREATYAVFCTYHIKTDTPSRFSNKVYVDLSKLTKLIFSSYYVNACICVKKLDLVLAYNRCYYYMSFIYDM